METGTSLKLHSRHSRTEYQLITTGELQQIEYEDSCNRREWELLFPTLGSDTPRHFIDCVRLVATRNLEIVKKETISKGDIVDKYTIVSHPWTEALTDLVDETKVLCRNDDSSVNGGGSYFQRISARLTEGGGSILEALTELAQCTVSLGVRYMWVDSICLDQCNAESMAFEIGRMYSYYKNSYCTIVNLNGLGEQTKLGEWPTTVARWFSRVWTFQEGLACHEVYFISAPITGILARVVAELMVSMKQDDTVHQLVTTLQIQQVHSTGHIHRVTSDEPKRAKLYEQVGARFPCCCCSVQCSVYYTEEDRHNLDERDVCMQQMHFRSHLYNWQQVYLICKWVVLITCTPDVKDALVSFNSLTAIYNFGLRRRAEQSLEVIEILEEICQRSCSHTEDRVLAVIGLLGIGATNTLRSGLSLYDQIKWLCGVAPPKVRHALIVKNCIDMYPSMPGSSWMPDLCHPDLGWLNQVLESPIGEWDYDVKTNRVIGKAQNPFSVIIIKTEEKDAGQITSEILLEFEELRLGPASDHVSWWTITLSFEPPVDPPDHVVTLEVLCVVTTNESGEIWGGQICWVNDYKAGGLDIGDIVGSSNLKNWQAAIVNQSLVGLPVIEELVEREGQSPAYDVGVLLCTKTEDQLLHKVGGLLLFFSTAREVAGLMYRHRQANPGDRLVQMN